MAQPHARSGQVVPLHPLAAVSPPPRTTAILKADQLEVVQIVLAAGTPSAESQLGPGDFIHLRRGEPHALTALEDATALLTICLAA